jgi:hypothetical protein
MQRAEEAAELRRQLADAQRTAEEALAAVAPKAEREVAAPVAAVAPPVAARHALLGRVARIITRTRTY